MASVCQRKKKTESNRVKVVFRQIAGSKEMVQWYDRLQTQIRQMEQMLLADFRESTGESTLDEGLYRMISAGGKRLRPSLAWVCFELAGKRRAEILPLMCMLEMMHTASLIHDDVVDGADERRGTPTIHSTCGTYRGVQCGDHLLAKAMEYLHIYRGMGINEVLSDTSRQMCLGEFRQMGSLYSLEKQDVDSYMIQIRQKTAYLLAASCYCGALAGGMSPKEAAALRQFGEYLGIAFQMEDDLLDFSSDPRIGKPAGQDIRNGIFTLPVLWVMQQAPDEEIAKLLEKREKSKEEMEQILAYIEEKGGISYTRQQIRQCSRNAIDSLAKLPDSAEKTVLCEMVQKLVERRV